MFFMENTIFYTTDNCNTYLYDGQYHFSMLINPELEKATQSDSNVEQYYIDKYKYLKRYGFFTDKKTRFISELKVSDVESSIIHTKQIVFEVTGLCNLQCTYCIQGDLYEGFDTRNNVNIDIDSALILLKHILELKVKNRDNELTISFYGGEPLINFNFIEKIVRFVDDFRVLSPINVTYTMTTNAILLSKHIDFFRNNKFRILISLDGDRDNNGHRKLRGSGKNSFDKVVENLDFVLSKYPEYFNEYINFNTVLSDKNSVKEAYNFFYSRYGKIPKISELAKNNLNRNKIDDFKRYYRNRRLDELELSKEGTLATLYHNQSLDFWELAYFLKYFSLNSYASNIQSLFNDDMNFPSCTCLPFSMKIFLSSNGKILPCEKISHSFALGDINEKVNIDVHQVAIQYTSYYKQLQKKCADCYINKYCGVCLFNIPKSNDNKLVCENYHSKSAFQKKLSRIHSFLENYPLDFMEIFNNITIAS